MLLNKLCIVHRDFSIQVKRASRQTSCCEGPWTNELIHNKQDIYTAKQDDLLVARRQDRVERDNRGGEGVK